MSLPALNVILDSIQAAEGGYWNDPIGGPTNFGITQTTLDKLRSQYDGLLPDSVDDLDKETARIILRSEYLEKTRVIELPYPLNLFHGHMAVMSWDDGIRIMQKRLGVPVDGVIGPVTLRAVRAESPLDKLYGLYSDVKRFIETRNNGFNDSYARRFNQIQL